MLWASPFTLEEKQVLLEFFIKIADILSTITFDQFKIQRIMVKINL